MPKMKKKKKEKKVFNELVVSEIFMAEYAAADKHRGKHERH